jgi:hypothetical protein
VSSWRILAVGCLAGSILGAAARPVFESPEGPTAQGEIGAKKRLTFEAASVKLNPSLSLRHVLLPPTGGRLSTRMAPLLLLIQNAYGVETFQISGGPDWMNTAGYDIEAKAEGNPSRSQIWLMLQSLLEDRFKLKVHRETKVGTQFYPGSAVEGSPTAL